MSSTDKKRIHIRSQMLPGDLGRVISMHAEIYAGEYGLNHHFESYVAWSLADFATRFDEHRDRLWLAEMDDTLVGSIGIANHTSDAAQLRWFLVSPDQRGAGLGAELFSKSIEFCKRAGYRTVFLWTFQKLTAAAQMYRNAGFQLTESTETTNRWGPVLIEQRYELLIHDK